MPGCGRTHVVGRGAHGEGGCPRGREEHGPHRRAAVSRARRALRLRARRGPCFSPHMNHALIVEALAAAYPDRECIVTPTRRLTRSEERRVGKECGPRWA